MQEEANDAESLKREDEDQKCPNKGTGQCRNGVMVGPKSR